MPFIGNKESNGTYITNICLEYMRVSIEYKIIVVEKVSLTIIMQILRQKNHLLLHFLLQFKIFQDYFSLAKLLCILGSKLVKFEATKKYEAELFKLGFEQYYEPALQAGIDMLFRMKKHDELLDIFLLLKRNDEAKRLAFRSKCLSLKSKSKLVEILPDYC